MGVNASKNNPEIKMTCVTYYIHEISMSDSV